MSIVSRFLDLFHGLFATKPRPAGEIMDSSVGVPSPSNEDKKTAAGSATTTKEFSLNASELRGVQRFQRMRGMNSEVAVVRFAIARLEKAFAEGQKERHLFTVPPPVKSAEAWKFSIGSKSEARLRVLLTRLRIRDENTVIRIATRDLLADSQIEV